MPPYIILQYPYDTIEIALCDNGNIITLVREHKFNAIKSTIPHIASMLANHNLTLKDLAFISVNVGPGPYNTLRALLTMANGIHFASSIPLVGLTALDLLGAEQAEHNNLVILQAFAGHVFYQFNTKSNSLSGACSISQLIEKINNQPTTFLALGNGAHMYQAELKKNSSNKLVFPNEIPLFNSLETLAQKSFELFSQGIPKQKYLKPIYFEDFQHKN